MISLIISFYKRLDILELILQSLDKQSFKEFEVIISEDDNDPQTVEFINKARLKHTYDIQHVSQEDKGFRKNKILNKALKIASYETIIFLDGDSIPHKNFVEQYDRHIARGKACFGRRIMLGEKFTSNLLRKQELGSLKIFLLLFSDSKKIEEGLYLPWFKIIKRGYRGIIGCNWGISKQDLFEVNGFDEDYIHACVGEDNDIEWRLRLNGIHFKSLKHKAIVFHMHHLENYNNEASLLNNELFEEKKKLKKAVCLNGLTKVTG
jgi:cellulose synthase/poly-beta-1,6-N-acetylglucosamine synthase-like glycosyltransferase